MNFFEEAINSKKLTVTSHKIADCFLQNPTVFLENDANKLGQLTKTSAAAIIRFCQQLGFKGLNDFKIKLAQVRVKPEEKIDPLVKQTDTPDMILKKLLVNSRQNTELTADSIDLESLNQAVKYLRQADHIIVDGIAASGLAATDFYYKLIRAGKSAFYSQDAHISLERIYFSTPSDVVVLFSYSGLTKEMIVAAQRARENKTKIIAITRSTQSLLAKLADVVINLPTKEKLLRVGAIDSLFSEIFVSSLLYLSTINKDLPRLEKEMTKTEELTNKLKSIE
ncbi:MurR/RpiR family transcriptional regulator [uncultured Lactobacillus sp.]|uniref:MurR/RpiR family transcriptional regulator n=1 Tax=uncultured Lactobacillus sp. TaxID=153152 RepID=UPI0026198B78|nr:MurR/RpiR family transcriptional regulator [uncultured Lactobacillus sp.]